MHWVRGLTVSDETHYVFGRIDQTTVGLTARLDHAFTPTLSVQLYAQPFVGTGRYTDFKHISDPTAAAYADRFDNLDAALADGSYRVDLNGEAAHFQNPDFNFKQFRSNAVLRWEYMPGSLLYVVWSQGRNHYARNGDFSFGPDLDTLFESPADDVFMIKLSYWMSR